MLINPWVRNYEKDDHAALGRVREWAANKLGSNVDYGFGYGTWVFIGNETVIKIDPEVGRPERFSHELAVSQMEIPNVATPNVLETGALEGRAWVIFNRLEGSSGYNVWPGLDSVGRSKLTSQLTTALGHMQLFTPDEGMLHAETKDWAQHIRTSFNRALRAVDAVVPGRILTSSQGAFAQWAEALVDRPRVLCHGDLWFGNILVDNDGGLAGILDFDRMALAPADYELDMLLRFWRYPWNFVPEQLEAVYDDPLDIELMKPFVELCKGDLSDDALSARLSTLELIYRLNLVNRFGWNDEHAEMFETVLSGDWAEGLV
ncbi:MAG TPA: aminoglycoside phosphotransferase family protein [Dehalococcoidia bacterium]|jgi:aminoglycoside phosphotransferase|nr:aminoglycoside phosphotransferase family protein [Dehalococcoidia bacterium]HIK89337.1 aminoglycoside phosphotransferase family protein [Dehalococcoidia bacterium]